MLKKMKSFYQMMFVVMFLFSLNHVQASESLSSITFSHAGKAVKEVFVGTPKNWEKIEDVEAPIDYKFTHESGDVQAYVAFRCLQTRPTKSDIFSTVLVMENLYGKDFLDRVKLLHVKEEDGYAFFGFTVPKDDKTEYVTVYSYLDNYPAKNCVTTLVFVSGKLDPDVFTQYTKSFVENIQFVNF